NNWGGPGLIPMSSVGEMDVASSRMKLFEKASLTSTPGGYRLMASRVDNYNTGRPEQNGYVVFDLFIKNFSGSQYLENLNPADEEAIYLTVDSEVTVANGGVENTGIENSVRVAFGQVGRVKGTTNVQSTITGITCANGNGVTGICRTAQIWEPNDKKHVANAISWYNTSCKKRIGANVTLEGSYSGTCQPITDNATYPTYAVKEDISSSDNVDIYDGATYNSYEGSNKLFAYNFLTDTKKELEGTSRPTFMTLAPNSITKVRVYIYIEGQDIDNYDFASIGKKVSIAFGFTKERFDGEDIDYEENNGPTLDREAPRILLYGANPLTIAVGSTYVEPGFMSDDDLDGVLTKNVIVDSSDVNTAEAGTYTVTYNVSDKAGNAATEVTRTVIVE
ncbi:MAG: DUF5011 domain-containing protein, partial [Thomasclavelia sp.]|nr:DUF5011 domain-containing protein [Thomasclavelia sp.]